MKVTTTITFDTGKLIELSPASYLRAKSSQISKIVISNASCYINRSDYHEMRNLFFLLRDLAFAIALVATVFAIYLVWQGIVKGH